MTELTSNSGRKLIPLLVIILLLLIINAFFLKTFHRKQINSDVIEYYSFVTAVFECKDLSFSSDCPKVYFANTTKDGKKVNKRSVGMAIMYLPWYGLAQFHSLINGTPDDGYSKTTEFWLVIGIWTYVLVGMYFLGLSLNNFFSLTKVYLILIMILTGTNLIWYTNGEVLFTHAVNFMWVSILIYSTIKYHSEIRQKFIVSIAISVGMLAIIRPNNLIFLFIPLLYNVYNRDTLHSKLELIRNHWDHMVLAVSVVFLISAPQLLYWKFATGKWIYYSYQGEIFYWTKPRIFDFLFSFRKGWFIYTPLMIFALLGIFRLPAQLKPFKWLLLLLVPLFIYVSSCWWAWSYGGCFGMRPMVDIYPLLAFPLAILVNQTRWYKRLLIIPLVLLIISLNYFQAWQFNKGILHYDQMNFTVYKSIWFKTKYPNDYDLLVSYPDYRKESRGEGAFYTHGDITNGSAYIKYIRSGFLQLDTAASTLMAGSSESDAGAVRFIFDEYSKSYLIQHLQTKQYLGINKESNLVEAIEDDIIFAERFNLVFLGENKFALQASNGYYLTANEGNFHYLKADALNISPTSIFTIKMDQLY